MSKPNPPCPIKALMKRLRIGLTIGDEDEYQFTHRVFEMKAQPLYTRDREEAATIAIERVRTRLIEMLAELPSELP